MEDDEHEPDTFTFLAVAAARVVDQLCTHENHDEQRTDNRERGDADKQKGEDHSRYVDHRLREWRVWERRISGKG